MTSRELQGCLDVLTNGQLKVSDFISNFSDIIKWIDGAQEIDEISKSNILAALKIREFLIDFEFCEKEVYTDSKLIFDLLLEKLRFYDREHMVCLYFDASMHFLSIETVAIGSVDTLLISPRDVFRCAFQCNASFIVMAHNHPSGDSTPGEVDIKLTKRFVKIGKLLGIGVLDHVVVGKNGYSSIYEIDAALFRESSY